MQSSARNGFMPSQSLADRAFHMPWTVSSTDTCELHLFGGDCGGLVGGAQEPSGSLRADELCRLAVEEHRPAADEHGAHNLVVAVDHARHPAVLLDVVLGVVVES